MNLRVSTRIEGDLTVVTAVGEIDVGTISALRDELRELTDAGRHHLVVHLEGVTFMDSSGLGVLVGALKRVRPHDGSIKLVALHPTVRRVFDVTKLTQVFPIYDTLDAALADEAGDAIPA